MAKGSDQSTFAINLEGNLEESAESGADAMEALRERITGGIASVKEMNGALRNLKGSSTEVAAAKNELKARIQAEQQAISAATVATLKAQKANGELGSSVKKLADEKKKLGQETETAKARTKALEAAVSTAGGPVAGLRDKISGLKDILGEGGAGGKMAFLTLGAAAAVTAMVALTAAVVGTLVSLTKFVIGAADGARSARLLREAAVGGNAQWGKQFGEQVDALSKKVPTARADIDRLGISLSKSNIGGQLWVDSLNAITQASAALGDDAGAKIKEFIDRSMVLGRPGLFRLNPQELIGTGITFKEVAAELATSMHWSVKKAQDELFAGRVKLADGAAAMRGAIEKKFGGINLRQMLSLDNLAKKLGETFDDLTKGVDLEPMLKSFKELAGIFALDSWSGQALKQIVSVFGNDFGGAVAGSTPLAKKFIYGLILGAQDITIAYLKTRNAIRGMIGPDTLKNADLLKTAVMAGKVAIASIGVAAVTVGAVLAAAALPVAAFALPFVILGAAVYGAIEGVKELAKVDWSATGAAIVDGLTNGINAGWDRLKKAVQGLGEGIKSSFKETLGIHSPSAVFAKYGEHTTAGYEEGVGRGGAGAEKAVSAMISPPSGGGSGGGGGRASVVVQVQINASGSNAREVAAQVSSASVIEQLTKAVVDACHTAGIAVT
jgi:hypothetical protein